MLGFQVCGLGSLNGVRNYVLASLFVYFVDFLVVFRHETCSDLWRSILGGFGCRIQGSEYLGVQSGGPSCLDFVLAARRKALLEGSWVRKVGFIGFRRFRGMFVIGDV